jgi:hypothetical protein
MIILQIKESMRIKNFDEALELIEQIPENFRTSEIFLLKRKKRIKNPVMTVASIMSSSVCIVIFYH